MTETPRAPRQDRSLPRIAALLRKAESTDNEHEAAAYMEAAQRIATAASIDLAVARAHTGRREARATPTQREVLIGAAGKRGLRTYVELFVAIAAANDVTCDVARNSTRIFAYGFEADLDTCEALYTSLIVQMVRASDEFIKSGAYAVETVRRFSRTTRRWEVGSVSPVTARISFQRAYAARIGRRLADARTRARREAERAERRAGPRWPWLRDGDCSDIADVSAGDAGATGRSVALALRAKEIQVAEHYRQHSDARGTWRGSSASAGYSPHASKAGDHSARRARLGTERALGGARPGLPGRAARGDG